MEPKEFDFEFPRGDTCPVTFELTDSDGNSLNMTDSEIYFTVKKSYRSSDFILQKKYSLGEIALEDNIAVLYLSHEDTANLSYGSYVYDIQFKSVDYVKTVAMGTITLTNEATWINNE